MAESGESGQEKTEQPSDKRVQDAREKGEVPHSREASNVIIFLTAVGMFFLLKNYTFRNIDECLIYFLRFDKYLEMTTADALTLTHTVAGFFFRIVGPLLAVVFVMAGASNVVQFGFVYSPERLEAHWDRLDVVAGLRRMVSLRSFTEGFKTALKILIIGVIVYTVFKAEMAQVEAMMDEPPVGIFEHIIWTSLKLIFKVSIFLVALAVLDFGYQRWEYYRKLRMSRQELVDEMKEREGSPLIKQRVRQIQMERARRRMMSEVPKSDVVITNPTHLAVAIKYESKKMRAPKVVAKGAGFVAEKIKEVAREHQIPIVENKPVAQIIYKTVKIGQEVPSSLYRAIAGVLAYVYKTAKKKPGWI
ncbi:MAG: flagellar biosynthesis protein FlhB [Candidatus Sumerlaeota bacterium]|nr:flagellar biosynthesis protein FlhB [Candidatus Sumerlaeota bacterium]